MLANWLDYVMRLWRRVEGSDLSLIAAGVAFFGFLAIFPAIAAVIAIWGFVFDPQAIQSQLSIIEDYLPAEAYDLIYGEVQRLLATANRRLGLVTVIPTLFALWSARAGVGALIGGLNAIHGLPARSGFRHIMWALVLTMVLVGLALFAIALAVVAPIAIGLLPLGPQETMTLATSNFALGLLVVTAAIAMAYRLGPNRPKGGKRPRWLTWGLVVAIILWALASRGLVFYLTNFANYNKVYGSIGAVVVLMIWFYLSAYSILLGAAVDAEAQSSHRPPPEP